MFTLITLITMLFELNLCGKWRRRERRTTLPCEPWETPHIVCQAWGPQGGAGCQWRTAPRCYDQQGWNWVRRWCWPHPPQLQAGTRWRVPWCLSRHARPPGWGHRSLHVWTATVNIKFSEMSCHNNNNNNDNSNNFFIAILWHFQYFVLSEWLLYFKWKSISLQLPLNIEHPCSLTAFSSYINKYGFILCNMVIQWLAQ